ncbi:protein-disulfide reductase DsbD domain-containing protein [Palleronia sp. LCG004]|uniref:protein-disulfide reductase DsbD domain-containing protein n=1 Tax=Palleronia sp. LCG004 TaxID=3079304 RepID=UPI0029426124|nr:protein-disulfide reductase DsbD domain-containing protein [Palleronia sp. LCG004]WOI55469.1 protein-disulfide reductase DsbD family protein [Palleronia sp. LCG004]
MVFRAILLLLLILAAPLRASTADVSLLEGWREGAVHIAAIDIALEPGWKTYWRAPGATGIPPQFDWSGSRNVADLKIAWPVPHAFSQNGVTSIGYAEGVVLPLIVTPRDPARSVDLRLTLSIGVCREICVPVTAHVTGSLTAARSTPDAQIRTALANRPAGAADAGAGPLRCRLAPAPKGARITAEVNMPVLGRQEHAVIELADPSIWVGVPQMRREGRLLKLDVQIRSPRGTAIGFNRQALTLTVIGDDRAIEIRGCD